MGLRFVILLVVLMLGVGVGKAREWTDVKGRSLEGNFVRQDEVSVWLKLKNGREVKIAKENLSEDDRKHLETVRNLPGQGERFNTRTIDPESWKRHPDGFSFDGLRYQAALQTKHFVVAADDGVRDNVLRAYAEAAERLWIDMNTDLPLLGETMKDRRMLVVLADGELEAKAFASWHGKHAEKGSFFASPFGLTTYNIVSFALEPDLAGKGGLAPSGRLFRTDAKVASNTRIDWAERIHFLASELIRTVLRPVRDNEDYTLSMLQLSYSFHREESICGGISTEVTFGGGEDIEGFSNGRNWAGSTRRIISRGGVGPSIDDYLQKSGSDATPRDLGFGHGLMCFIHQDPVRLAGFNELLKTSVKEKKAPDAKAFAKGLGYESPADLDTAWLAFMKSSDFE